MESIDPNDDLELQTEIAYLSMEIMEWAKSPCTHTSFDSEAITRSHEIWEHASALICDNAGEFSLADAISNLKKSIDQRLKSIEAAYQFRRLFPKSPKKKYFEILTQFGIIRPYLIEHLFETRNGIEHNGNTPPSIARCRELLDLTWYFLKSTDNMLINIPKGWELNADPDGDEKYWLELDLDNCEDKYLSIRGWFPVDLIQHSPGGSYFKVVNAIIESKSTVCNKQYFEKMLETDRHLSGRIHLDNDDGQRILRHLLV